MVRTLLASKANPAERDADLNNALHLAVMGPESEPAWVASEGRRSSVVEELIGSGRVDLQAGAPLLRPALQGPCCLTGAACWCEAMNECRRPPRCPEPLSRARCHSQSMCRPRSCGVGLGSSAGCLPVAGQECPPGDARTDATRPAVGAGQLPEQEALRPGIRG